jgi:hypothetical protein
MKLAGLVVAIAAVGVLPNSSAQAPFVPGQAWGQANAGLRIGIAAVNRDNAPSMDVQFDVALENTGAEDFVLNLGHMLANGKVIFPSSIRLILTDPSGRTSELQYFDRRYPGVAGRVDDFTVALRVGSVHTIRATMDHYWSPSTKEFGVKLTDGRYRIVARFEGEGARTDNSDMPGVALMNFWKGIVQSNPLEFVVSGKAASN